jgi:glycine/D-amino acid oxidase-like deaminating enzyme
MRLRTVESYWLLKNGLIHSYPSIEKNLKTEVVVLGAGITGALVSHAVRSAGYEVVVIDQGDVAFGSTSATTSMLQYEIDLSLVDLSKKIGDEGADYCYQAGVRALDEIERLVKEENLECSYEKKNSLLISHNEKAGKQLKEEFNRRKSAGLPVKWLTAAQVKKNYSLKCFGAILSSKAASIDAYRLAHALFHKNSNRAKNPIRVFDQTPVKKIKDTARSVKLELENGYSVTCKHIIYCTGFQTTEILKEKVGDLFDTYAVISEQGVRIPPKFHKTLFWNTDSPYLYMRTTDDGRLLIGGEDSSFRMNVLREKLKNHRSKNLIQSLKEISPGIEFVEDFTWAGTFGQTKDGLPYIGKSPEYKRSLFVLGFGGNGITYSVQAMKLIPLMLEGKETKLGYYYRFGR